MTPPTDTLSTPPVPNRVYYSLGRMLGVEDFQADQDYHRGRLACALLQLFGTGTVSGLNVQTSFPAWQASLPVASWAFVVDATSGNVQVNTGKNGVTGGARPAWAAVGSSVNEGDLVWTNEGPVLWTGWQASKPFTFPSVIVDSNFNFQVLTVTAGLTTGAAVPAWNTNIGGVTPDGGVAAAWTCLGPTQLEIQVTPGMAIDRAGRILQVPRPVCIRLQPWLTLQDPAILNAVIKNGNVFVDVFATFVGCTRGLTPCFATQDDYDATDAFSPNRLLDSFAMQLVLRTDVTDANSNLPVDPWLATGTLPTSTTNTLTPQNLKQSILNVSSGPAAAAPWATAPALEYPKGFDPTAVFLARITIPATAGNAGKPPTFSLGNITINNLARLFLFPAALAARWTGLSSGAEK